MCNTLISTVVHRISFQNLQNHFNIAEKITKKYTVGVYDDPCVKLAILENKLSLN